MKKLNVYSLENIIRLANHLDSKGLYKEADALDNVVEDIKKYSYNNPQQINLNDAALQYNLKPVGWAGGVAFMTAPNKNGKSIGIWVGYGQGVFLGRNGKFKYVIQKPGKQIKLLNEGLGFSMMGISQGEKKQLGGWLKYLMQVFKQNPSAIPSPPPPPPKPAQEELTEENYYEDSNYNEEDYEEESYDEEYREQAKGQTYRQREVTTQQTNLIQGNYEFRRAVSHNLGIAGAKQKVDQMIADLDRQITPAQRLVLGGGFEGTWDDNTINITSPVAAIGVVSENRAELATNFIAAKPSVQRLVDGRKNELIQKIASAINEYFPQ